MEQTRRNWLSCPPTSLDMHACQSRVIIFVLSMSAMVHWRLVVVHIGHATAVDSFVLVSLSL